MVARAAAAPSVAGMPTAIVTGASRGLGLALARALAERGWRLVIDAREAAPLEAAAAQLPGRHRHPRRRRRPRATARRSSQAAGGALDLLVNNASLLGPSPQPRARRLPARRARARLPRQRARAARADPARAPRRGARIVNVTSDAAVEPYEGWGGYGSSKAALEQLTAILAAEHPDAARLRRRPRRHEHAHAPGGVPGRGHLRPPAARGAACPACSR